MGDSITVSFGGEQSTCKYEALSTYGFAAMPSIFQQQIAFDEYDGEDDTFVSASKFANPPKSVAMGLVAAKQNMKAPAIYDLSMPTFIGTAAHSKFEKAPVKGYQNVFREIRYNMMLETLAGIKRKISGKFDLLFQKTEKDKFFLCDYKTEKAWATTFDSPGHIIQLSINRLLLTMGIPADGHEAVTENVKGNIADIGVIFGVYRDWELDEYFKELERCSQQGKQCQYPSSPWSMTKIRLMPLDETLKFATLFAKEVESILAGKITECPKSDLWRYSKFYGHKRCAFYCPGRRVCHQFAEQLRGSQISQEMLQLIGMTAPKINLPEMLSGSNQRGTNG